MRRNRLYIGVICAVLVLASCGVVKPYQQPQVATQDLYRDVDTNDTSSIANMKWDELFTDPKLQGLIRKAIDSNPDLRIAFTRVQQAEALYLQSRSAFLPSLDANVGVTESKLSEVQGFGIRNNATQYQLGLSASWEADIWGRLASNRRANLAALLQTNAAARAVQTSIVATVANLYYTLLALDQQLLVTQQTVRNWDTTVQTMRALKDAARVTEAAVVQSEAQRYAAEVTLPDIRQRLRETENALSILLGEPPTSVDRGVLTEQQVVETLTTGIPAQLLSNRPDVQVAELGFRNAFELTNVARTNFYPALRITGNAGLSSLALGNLFDIGSLAANIGAGLTQPIFNQRANRTRLEIAQAQQQEALINFRNSLLVAGSEVSDALSLHQTSSEKVAIRRLQINSLQLSVEYSQELLQHGFANYTEVINARQSLLQAELGNINDRLERLQSVVELYRALGGG